MELFFKSNIFWQTVPFLNDEQRVPWISRQAEIQSDAPDGTVAILNHFKIVYVQHASPEMIIEARKADLVFDFSRSLPIRNKQATSYYTVNYPGKNRLRWIYPLDNKRSSFLHFYYLDTCCSTIAAFVFCMLFYINRWFRKHTFNPLLFDFFHYILQKNIYSGKGSSEAIAQHRHASHSTRNAAATNTRRIHERSFTHTRPQQPERRFL